MSLADSQRSRRARLPTSVRGRAVLVAWAFIVPAFIFYATFVLVPIGLSIYYSLLRWDGIGKATFKGLSNYLVVLSESDFLQILGNAFQLVAYFTLIPVAIGLGVASAIASGLPRARCCSSRRSSRWSPPVLPGAGCWPATAS